MSSGLGPTRALEIVRDGLATGHQFAAHLNEVTNLRNVKVCDRHCCKILATPVHKAPFMLYPGSCHCGAIAFEVEAAEHIVAQDCNCSICAKAGFLHLIVPKSKFRLIRGDDHLTTYTFNTGVAQHLFCKVCGIKAFYVPRSNPDGIDVNVRCLDIAPRSLTIEPFDGRNWEHHAASLAHLSDNG